MKKFNIKKHITKIGKIKPLVILAIGIVLGAMATYSYFLPKLTYQGKTVEDWAITANKNQIISDLNQKSAALCTEQLVSISAQLKSTLAIPAPTPIVKYIDKTPLHPNLSSCTLQGNFYFCPSDNCYYNPNGSPTGECKIPPMGGF